MRMHGLRFLSGGSAGKDLREFSWPVATRRIKYQQHRSETGQRTWGSFTFGARDFGLMLKDVFPCTDNTHILDGRLVEWFIDSDSHDVNILRLPQEWRNIDAHVHRFIRENNTEGFCLQCAHTHPLANCTFEDDSSRSEKIYCYKRTLCPHEHLLLETLYMRKCVLPGNFKRGT